MHHAHATCLNPDAVLGTGPRLPQILLLLVGGVAASMATTGQVVQVRLTTCLHHFASSMPGTDQHFRDKHPPQYSWQTRVQ